ncbi:hypothetical protein N431DRAFT_434748 [Stipitochalara longipes BDJ]|nr:hypothetical protein N431DRAFT_434748 [Stipitochalara longipes BDJ]
MDIYFIWRLAGHTISGIWGVPGILWVVVAATSVKHEERYIVKCGTSSASGQPCRNKQCRNRAPERRNLLHEDLTGPLPQYARIKPH